MWPTERNLQILPIASCAGDQQLFSPSFSDLFKKKKPMNASANTKRKLPQHGAALRQHKCRGTLVQR